MRRVPLALFGAVTLAIGAAAVPAAAASPHSAGSLSAQPTTATAQQCGTDDSYGIRLCIALVSSTFVGQATVHAPPSNCAGYRVSLYDSYTNQAVASTSLRPCGESPSKQVTADASRFSELTAYADLTMYNSAGSVILDEYTPGIAYS